MAMTYAGLFTFGPYGGRWNINFQIKETDKVLDLGGGLAPYPYATDIIDKADSSSDKQRYGKKLKIGNKTLWDGYGEDILPTISDKYFDFIYSSHTLEHVTDLPLVLTEINRTCKRGFIIVPHYYMDIWSNGKSSWHKWLFSYDHENNVLKYRKRLPHEYFEELCQLQPPALDWMNTLIQSHNNEKTIRALWEIRFYWEDEIRFQEDLKISEESKYIMKKENK